MYHLPSEATVILSDVLSLGRPGSNTYMLLAHLISYFGVLLDCSGYGADGFPTYGGSNSQYNVHKYMDLSQDESNYSNRQIGLAASSFGFSDGGASVTETALTNFVCYRCPAYIKIAPNSAQELQVICQGEIAPPAILPLMAVMLQFPASLPANLLSPRLLTQAQQLRVCYPGRLAPLKPPPHLQARRPQRTIHRLYPWAL